MSRYLEKIAHMPWRARLVHVLFDIGAIAKGIDGVLEVIGGGLLLLVDPHQLHHLARFLLQHELSEDPDDIVATYLLHTSQHVSAGTQTFAAAYLLWHGVVKVGLVTGLLLRQRWAYPAAIVAFLLFLAYQLYRYTHTYSAELLVLSVFDVFIIVLTWLEYTRLRTSGAFS
jgi:uncharacterized membrane protein